MSISVMIKSVDGFNVNILVWQQCESLQVASVAVVVPTRSGWARWSAWICATDSPSGKSWLQCQRLGEDYFVFILYIVDKGFSLNLGKSSKMISFVTLLTTFKMPASVVVEIGSSLKPNLHTQIKCVQIPDIQCVLQGDTLLV